MKWIAWALIVTLSAPAANWQDPGSAPQEQPKEGEKPPEGGQPPAGEKPPENPPAEGEKKPEEPKPPEEEKPVKGPPCDMLTRKYLPFCKTCNKILGMEETVQENFCKKCTEGKARKDWEPLERVEACVKYYYTCDEHKIRSWQAGMCGGCKKWMKQNVDRARITNVCEGCGDPAEKGCPKETCKGKGVKKGCEKSGTYPHVPEK